MNWIAALVVIAVAGAGVGVNLVGFVRSVRRGLDRATGYFGAMAILWTLIAAREIFR